MRYLPLMLKNCWRNRRRTILTVASIGISMCLFGVMAGMYHAFFLSAPEAGEASRVVTRNKISLTVAIPLAYEQQIAKVPGVKEVMLANWFSGTYKDNRDPKNQFPRFSVEPDKLFTVYGEFKIPDDQRRDFIRDRTGCVISRDLANQFGFKLGDRITLVGDIYPGNFEFTVRGIFDTPRPGALMYFNKEYIDQSLPERRRGSVGLYYVLIDDPQKSPRISAAIDEMYRNSTAQTKTESEQAFNVGFLSLLGNVKVFLMAICGAVLFTMLLVSANTMAMSVRERVREIGVLKTLGFTSNAVLGIVLGEAAAISVAGGIIGYGISMFLLAAIGKSPYASILPAFPLFEPMVALTCLAIAGAIGVFSALVPAAGAARAPIVQSLRSSD